MWDTLCFLLFVIWIQARNTRRKSLELAASLQGWVLCRLPFCAQYRVPNWSGVDDFLSIAGRNFRAVGTGGARGATPTPPSIFWQIMLTIIILAHWIIRPSYGPDIETNLVVYGNQFVTLHNHAIIHTQTRRNRGQWGYAPYCREY